MGRYRSLSLINRVACVTASLALSLCMVPSAAFAAAGEPATAVELACVGGTSSESFFFQENSIVSLAAAEEFELDSNGAPALKPGNYARWIDRINIPQAYIDFYWTLVSESRSASGKLADPGPDGIIEVASGSVDLSQVSYTTRAATAAEREEEVTAYVKKLLREPLAAAITKAKAYTSAAAHAFIYDCPEVFWLGDDSYTSTGTSYSWSGPSSDNGDGSYTYTVTAHATWQLNYVVTDSAYDIDIRLSDYRDASAIAAGMAERDANARAIVSDITADGAITSTYEILKRLNKWLTSHNDYNTSVASGNSGAAPASAWRCTSALDGRNGPEGPVCEGYARAFKVVCDKLGIPCTLTTGLAKSSASSASEAHMWNYVQVGGKWYAEDATWNDPVGPADTSGTETYFLVGANTVIKGLPFIESHPVSNLPSDSLGCPSFTNCPVLESDRCPEDSAWEGEGSGDPAPSNPGADEGGSSEASGDPSTIVVGKTEYKVTGTKAVALTKPLSSAAKVSVPATITAGGITYKVAALAASAFAGSKAKSINVGANVMTIGNKAFANCANLTSLTLGAAVKTIGANVLSGSKKLTSVTVNSSKLTKASITNLLKGTQVKTIKCGKNVTKKAKASYLKWAKAAKKGTVVK